MRDPLVTLASSPEPDMVSPVTELMWWNGMNDGRPRSPLQGLAAILLALLAGCAGVAPDAQDRHLDTTAIAAPVSDLSTPVQAPATQESPAVVALLDQADNQRSGGQLERSVATVERALRIEPRNPRLWLRLAELRLAMAMPERAEQLAMKAKALAVANPVLIEKSWRLIAQARYQRGDTAGAAEALRQAGNYRE